MITPACNSDAGAATVLLADVGNIKVTNTPILNAASRISIRSGLLSTVVLSPSRPKGGRFIAQTPDFYRPYWQNPNSGVAPEPWHLSYRPVAQHYSQQLSIEGLRQFLLQLDDEQLMEKQGLLNALDTIYHHYIQCD